MPKYSNSVASNVTDFAKLIMMPNVLNESPRRDKSTCECEWSGIYDTTRMLSMYIRRWLSYYVKCWEKRKAGATSISAHIQFIRAPISFMKFCGD